MLSMLESSADATAIGSTLRPVIASYNNDSNLLASNILVEHSYHNNSQQLSDCKKTSYLFQGCNQ